MGGEDSKHVTYFPLLVIVLCACNERAHAIVLRSDLYSLIGGEIMRTLPDDDDAIGDLTVNPPFSFFGSNYEIVHVRNL